MKAFFQVRPIPEMSDFGRRRGSLVSPESNSDSADGGGDATSSKRSREANRFKIHKVRKSPLRRSPRRVKVAQSLTSSLQLPPLDF